eukprot:s1031_g29.t1
MDNEWIFRLMDERPGFLFLTEYSRSFRLATGLCSLGAVRAHRDARLDDGFRMSILANPVVRQAARLDPRAHPIDALRAASTDLLREMEQWAGPFLLQVPRCEAPSPEQVCAHVYYRGQLVTFQVATFTQESTGKQLIEQVAHHVFQNPKLPLVQVLCPGETVLEVHFGQSEHSFAVNLSARAGRVKAFQASQSTVGFCLQER